MKRAPAPSLMRRVADLRATIRALAADDDTATLSELVGRIAELEAALEADSTLDDWDRANLGRQLRTVRRLLGAEQAGQIPPVVYTEPPVARDHVVIVWNADGSPGGLIMDDRSYRVVPSPELRYRRGQTHQTILRVDPYD